MKLSTLDKQFRSANSRFNMDDFNDTMHKRVDLPFERIALPIPRGVAKQQRNTAMEYAFINAARPANLESN